MFRSTLGYVNISNYSEASEIYHLRLQAYSNAPEFSLMEPETLRWGQGDEEGIVLTAYNNNEERKPIATTSGRILHDKKSAEEIMECKWIDDNMPDLFPALLLGKGATAKGLHNLGLHSVLRYYFIKAAISCGVKSLLGIVFESAPRTKLMRQIGYDFVEAQSFWYTDLKPSRATLIGILNKQNFDYAITELYKGGEETIKNYPADQKLLDDKMIEILMYKKEETFLRYQNQV